MSTTETDFEKKVWSRIEGILLNDARNQAELERMAESDETLPTNRLEQELDYCKRIINNYRIAVGEVNSLLESNISFLSAFYRIIETIKDKENLSEICSQFISCALAELGTEYGGLVFFEDGSQPRFCVEGIYEGAKFVQVHDRPHLLGSERFDIAIRVLLDESSECHHFPDAYRETRFNEIDFPSVVRSLLCLPITQRGHSVGGLIFSHSTPQFFNENHMRVLMILAGNLAHLKLLTTKSPGVRMPPAPIEESVDNDTDNFSLVVIDCEKTDALGRTTSLDRSTLREIRSWLYAALRDRESILFHGPRQLLVLLPATSEVDLSRRVGEIQSSFELWRQSGEQNLSCSLSLGFSTCDDSESLLQSLDAAAFMMRPETDEEFVP